ncbi:MAG: hypothetical protein ACYC33_13060 [Thermoleophilia bacterium]
MHALLALGWLLAFGLLASGRRRWGLGALSVVLIGFVVHSVQTALGYGGPFSWPFTLHFFLPVLLPLLFAYAWPSGSARLRAWSWSLILVLVLVVPPLSSVRLPGLELLLGAGVALTVLAMSLSDPRWAVATGLVVSVPVV